MSWYHISAYPFFACREIPDKLREMNLLLSIISDHGGKRKEKIDLISEKIFHFQEH